MTTYQFCLSETANYPERDAYISDLALSSLWGDEPDDDIPTARLDWLGQLYDAANRSVKEIATSAGLSQRKLAERFGIPYRTVENWCSGVRSCPDYVRLMMQECLGLVSHDPKEAPTIDAVPVVRCQDCIHAQYAGGNMFWCGIMPEHPIMQRKDSYCNCGQREVKE